VVNDKPKQSTPINLDKVINDLMEQLKEMETHYNDSRSPRSEMEHAGKQIQTVRFFLALYKMRRDVLSDCRHPQKATPA